MSTIDQRIVDMKFNNAQFEAGIKSSIEALERLKAGLKLEDSAKGLTNLEKVGKAFSLSGVSKAVDAAAMKFNAFSMATENHFKNMRHSASEFATGVQSIFSKLAGNKDTTISPKFDNKQFEAGIHSSGQMIDKFTSNAASDLGELDRATKGFDFSEMANGIDHIASKFNALTVIGVTALSNITNSVINTGKSMVSALTIDPIKTGLSEYETKMNAIQTILTNTASKGTTLKDVNATLEELNAYSDKTIYNFAEMARNIGTFTAAGVELKTSATAIKGIANLAAGSGSNAQQASTAMYQLSQALAAGSVKLMDWNSVVNAGMGGELFQNALKDTAKQMGIVVDTSIPFRESLEKGWITAEVLTKTLAKFAEDESLVKAATQVKTFTQLFDTMKESVQSGWAQSWENIIGNKDEAAELFTNINNVFGQIAGSSAEARNGTLKFWKANGGREAMIQGLSSAFKALQAVLKPVGEAFREVFPAVTGATLVKVSEQFRDLLGKFKMGENTARDLKSTFKGFFALLDIGKQVLMVFSRGISTVVNGLAPIGSSMLGVTAAFGEYLVTIDEMIKKTGLFDAVFSGIATVISKFAKVASDIVNTIKDVFKSLFEIDLSGMTKTSNELNSRIKPYEVFKSKFEEVFGGLTESVGKITPIFKELGSAAGSVLKTVAGYVAGLLKSFDSNTMLAIINGAFFVAITKGLTNFMKPLEDIAEHGSGFLGNITGILDGVKGSLKAYQSDLKSGTLLKLAGAIGILAVSLVILSTIDQDKLTNALAAITVLFAELFATMFAFEKTAGLIGLGPLAAISAYFLGLSVTLLILAGAVRTLAELDWDGLKKGLVGVGTLCAMLTLMAKSLATTGGMIKGVGGLILFAGAIYLLAETVEKLSKLDFVALGKGLLGVGVLMGELALFLKIAGGGGLSVSGSLGLLGMAAAIFVLAASVEKFGNIDTSKLKQGLTAIGVVLTEIVVFMKATGDSKMLIATAIGLTILAGAMNIMANNIIVMGSYPIETIGKGLLALGGALAIIASAMWLMPPNMLASSVALMAVSVALNTLSNSLINMSKMTWSELGIGLVALAGSLTIIAVATAGMTTALPGAAALLVVAGAIGLLVPSIAILGSMPIQAVGIALLAMAGTFAVIGLAGLALTPIVPTLVLLGGAIALLGLGCLAAGVGISAFSVGLVALVGVASTGVTAVISIFKAAVDLLPYTFQKLGEGIVELAKVIEKGAPVIAKAFVSVLKVILDTVKQAIPLLISTLSELIVSLIQVLVESIPKLVDAGGDIIIGILTGIARMLPKVIDAAFNVIVTFVDGLANAIRKNTDPMIAAMGNLISAMVEAGVKTLQATVPRFKELGKNVIDGFVEGIKGKIGDAAKWAANLAQATLTAAKKVLDINSPSRKFKEEVGEMIGEGTAEGIKKSSKKAAKESEEMAKKAVEAAKKAYEQSASWIDDRKYYNEMALNSELESWERVQSRYLEGTEERKKADKEVYRVRQAIAKAELDYANDVLRVQSDANKSRIELEDEYYDRTKAINDKLKSDIKGVTDAYKDAIKSRTRELYNAYGLFDKVEQQSPVEGKDLLSNLQSQVDQFDSWKTSLNSLSGRGVSEDLMNELEQMGPQSAAQIEALSKMSDEELTQYQALWKTKYNGAREQAVSELEGLRQESLEQIEMMKSEAAEELDAYNAEWAKHMQQLKVDTASELERLKIDWMKKIGTIKTESQKQFVEMTTNIQKTVMSADWSGLGQNIVDGMKSGIKSKAAELAEEAARVARRALEAAKDELGIASPSKEFAKLGMYADLGLALGLKNFAGVVTDSAKNVGRTAISALQSVISNISEVVNAGLDVTPVIRPVLDLSDIASGTKQLSTLMAQSKGLNLGAVVASVPSVGQNGSSNPSAVTTPQPAKIEFNQYNTSPKALSRLDIYRQTKNQIASLKGVVVPT